MFDTRYFFIYAATRSKEYLTASGAVRDGAEKVNDHPHADGWRVSVVGQNDGVLRPDFRKARARAVELLQNRPIGDTIRMECVKDGAVIDSVRFRKALKVPAVKDTPGPIGLDRVEGYIESTYKNARWAGDCVCKPDSDHADCAAVDYFDTDANMVKMRDALLRDSDYFNIKYIILFDRIWFPGGSSSHHDGTFHAHIHVSVTGGQDGAAC